MKFKFLMRSIAVTAAALSTFNSATACDVCALYTAVQVESPISQAFRLSLAEQFTSLDRIKRDGQFVENQANQFLKSSVTQISGQYDVDSSISLQVVVPVVSRTWRRMEGERTERGSTAGIGDVNLLAHYVPLNYSQGNSVVRLRIFGGLELPTGDAHYLGEESSSGHHGDTHDQPMEEEEESHSDHHSNHAGDHHAVRHKHNGVDHSPSVQSAVHGHDVTLGSGSWDVPLGVGLFTQWRRYIWATDAQYTVRTEGAFGYQFANDWAWSTALGRYLYLDDNAQIGLRARLSGQYKGYDTGNGGERFSDTAFNSTFLGPELTALFHGRWQGLVSYELPLNVHNSDLQITPGYRIRAALTYRF